MRNFYLLLLLSLWSLHSFAQEPAISSFSPSSGGQGSTVVINGTNLSNVKEVTFGGVPVISFTEVSDTKLTAEIGYGASGEVAVTTALGTSSKPGFTFLSQIKEFSPVMATSGTKVTITGTYLLGATAVKFGNKPAASFNVINATTIEAIVGVGASGSVVVTLPIGSPPPRSGFKFVGITAMSPAMAKEGETVTLSGTNLTSVSSVKFGGVEAASFTLNSATSITAVVGKGASGDVTVTTPTGVSTLPGFTFIQNQNAPTISSVTPLEATTGDIVTIKGNNLSGATSVKFGNTEATILSNTADVITAEIREGSTGDVVVITPEGEGLATDFIFLDPPPVITSFHPQSAGPGGTVTIEGKNFSDVYLVRFGGASAASFKLNDNGTISAIVGSGATGPVSVVGRSGQHITTDIFTFEEFLQPEIDSFTPASAQEGEEVLISGTNLLGATSVSFGTVEAASFKINSSTSITAVVGKGSSGDISVTTPFGKAMATDFTYLESEPIFTDFSPKSGSKGTAINLTGTNLDGVASVTFGGTEAASFIINSPTSITAILGEGTSGDVVVTKNKKAMNLSGFIFISTANPTITSFKPKTGFTGTPVIIAGTNFVNVISVKFGNTEVSFKVNNPNSITATVQAGSSGLITVTTATGSFSMAEFKYLDPLPFINSFSPVRAQTDMTVTIEGSNFKNVKSVKFGNTEASSFVVESENRILAVVGTGASGDVTVTTESGTGQPRGGFSFISTPLISSFSPAKAKSGTSVTIVGSNFIGVSSVQFGNMEAKSFQVLSPTEIIAVVAGGASGDISVTTTGGIAYAQDFIFLQAPTISSFTPATAGENEEVLIQGTNLTEASSISFGGLNAKSFRINSATSITAIVDRGSSGDISLETPGGTANKPGFIFIPPPSLSNFSPAIATTGGVVTITGENFREGTTVTFGGEPATSVVVNSPTNITAIVGKGASGAIAVKTRGGQAEIPGFIYIPELKIIAEGPTTFSTGNSVVLKVSTGLNYSYQWSRNGVDILGAKGDTYTAVTSGSYTVTMLYGSYRIKSDPLFINTVFTLPANNFKVLTHDEPCSSSNNGSVQITAEKYLKYNVRITGEALDENYTFYLSKKIEHLPAGNYTLCVTVDEDRSYKQYFDIRIAEPKDLAVYSSVTEKKLILELQGADLYKVKLNGKEFTTSNSVLRLDLTEGENKLTVTTDKECQGIFEKTFVVNGNPLVYPIPFADSFNVVLAGKENGYVNAEIQSLDGKLVYKQVHEIQNGSITIAPVGLSAGVYLLKLQSDQTNAVIKIVKK